MQVMASLSRILPSRKVLEMCMTGRTYHAEEALQWGLITKISHQESIKEEVAGLADLICSNAPLAIQRGMQAFTKMKEIPESEQHSFLKNALDALLKTEDAREGAAAFKEKRNPVWKGK